MPLKFLREQKSLIVELKGDVVRYDSQPELADLLEAVDGVQKVSFVADELGKWDSTMISALYQLALKAKEKSVAIAWKSLPQNVKRLLELALAVDRKPEAKNLYKLSFFEGIGEKGISIFETVCKAGSFLKESLVSVGRFFSGKAVMRWVDFEFSLEDCSYKAVGIVSLVSFMVGLILAFVGAIQLKMFGAQIYIASLVTIGMTRIMGAIMVGIIMAGRTGASYAATIGTMQVNEEIDALKTLGISIMDFLVLPRTLSLVLTMPFLTLLADVMGMIGGAFVAVMVLDISAVQYWQYSINAFYLKHLMVGIFHGLVYGIIIAECGCYYGINCGRNADSVGVATTKAVVASVVIMIVATGILTLLMQVLGI
ncbi:MAG: ABC transporter permease [Alphaproteobacteria bacterium]|nr:ABC transporter permease [Alphaproteobacteria bacterium]